jgi:mono/diheme cytochrome c family protein
VKRVGGALAGLVLVLVFGGDVTWVVGQPAQAGGAAGHPGKAAYDQHCATCHGPGGESDGPGADALPIKPPRFTDGRLMNGLPDDFMVKVVAEGAAAVGLAPQMPAFGKILTERQIQDVVAYVRTFEQPAY